MNSEHLELKNTHIETISLFSFLQGSFYHILWRNVLKFKYSEKATKMKKNLPFGFDFSRYVMSKLSGKLF